MAVTVLGHQSPMFYDGLPDWIARHRLAVAVFLDADPDGNRECVAAWGPRLGAGRTAFLCQARDRSMAEEQVAAAGLERSTVIILPDWSGGGFGPGTRQALERLDPLPDAVLTAVSYDPRGFSAGAGRPRRGRLRKLALEWGLCRYLRRWKGVLLIQDDEHGIVRLADWALLRDRFVPRFARIALYAATVALLAPVVHVAAFVSPVPGWRTQKPSGNTADDPAVPTMTAWELIAHLRKGGGVVTPAARVLCERFGALPFRDLIELNLCLSRVGRWTFVDKAGAVGPRQGLMRIVWNLARDALAWPWLYLRHSARAARLAQGSLRMPNRSDGDGVLYLRTDHIFDQQYGGSVTHTAGVVNGFRKAGVPVRVVSTDRLVGIPNDEDFFCVEPRYGIGRNIPNMAIAGYNDQLAGWLDSHWPDPGPGLIYQRYSQGNYAGVTAAGRLGVPLVLEYNGSEIWTAKHWGGRAPFHERLLGRIERANLRAAHLVTVVSRPLADIVGATGVPVDRIIVNPNGVDAETYHPRLDGGPVRSRLGLGERIVIGFVGSFGAWHGAEVLAEAFGLLLAREPALGGRLRLLMVGDGNTMPEVRRRLAAAGAGEAAVLPGAVPQADGPAHLAACDILISPHIPNPDGSPFFGSPTKLFEYMAMGRPIIASELDQIGEVLRHGETAWLVPPNDPAAIADGLRTLVDDLALRDALGRRAREDAVRNHTWERHVERLFEAIEARLGVTLRRPARDSRAS